MSNLENLLTLAQTAKPTSLGYLDGRYFNVVLAEYKRNLVREPIVLKITEYEEYEDEKYGKVPYFRIEEVSKAIAFDLDDSYPAFIRLIIEIDYRKTGSSVSRLVTRHSNLIILDPNTKTAYRFEPLDTYKFQTRIDEALRKYFKTSVKYMGENVGYELREFDSHPQGSGEDRGMCLAYVLKYAVMFALGREGEFDEDTSDIRKFAAAVKYMYKRYLPPGEPDVEFGVGGMLIGGGTGLLVAGPVGMLVGGGVGALV